LHLSNSVFNDFSHTTTANLKFDFDSDSDAFKQVVTPSQNFWISIAKRSSFQVLRLNTGTSQLKPHIVALMPAEVQDDISFNPPPRKRLRQDPDSVSKSTAKDLRLFVPFRALGLITNHVPFVLQTRSHKGATDGPRIHLLTCLGRAWALWEGGKMGLLFVGE
jgi:hypothetical protein